MADNTGIEWTDASWNPIRARNKKTGKVGWFCERKSPGCDPCYAESMNAWRGTGIPFKPGHRDDIELFLDENILMQPLRWRRPRMIFPCSMTDLFGSFVPEEMIDRIFTVMALTPRHIYQPLTKRPDRMRDWFRRDPQDAINSHAGTLMHWDIMPTLDVWPLPNIWPGTSVEDQRRANERIPVLMEIPAAKRWISAEPLLGPIDLETAWHGESALDAECWGDCGWCEKGYPPLHNCRRKPTDYDGRSGLDWVVTGGQSGSGAKPMHPDWARQIRDDCKYAGVSFLFKQWGQYRPICDLRRSEMEAKGRTTFEVDGQLFANVGKKRAGRLLDGIEHNGFPEIARS